MLNAIEMAARVIAWTGIAIIAWGVLLAIFRLIVLEGRRFRGANICQPRELIRHHLGSYLLLGLEILVAADIILTVLEPSLEELAILGGLVVVRTVINYSLNRELAGHSCSAGSAEKR